MKKFLPLIAAFCLLLGAGFVYAIGFDQDVTANVVPGIIDINSPLNGELYTDRMVPINLSMTSTVEYFRYADNGGEPVTLCRDCEEYGYSKIKRKPFDDGFHEVVISALFQKGAVYETRSFRVDTQTPKITETSPTSGFDNGLLSLEFQEANPEILTLNYGNDAVGWRTLDVDLDDCYESDRNMKKCDVDADFSDYNSKKIKYWFNLTDIAGRSGLSRQRTLDVDTSKPVLNSVSYNVSSGRLVRLTFDITEANFDKLVYTDFDDPWPMPITLCEGLMNGLCNRFRYFSEGPHNLLINIIDKAGNIKSSPLVFYVG